jgi:hypothetical protein
MTRRAAFLLVIGLFLASGATAQEPAKEPASRPETRSARWGILYFDGDVVYLIEDVLFRFGDTHLRCDTAILWLAKEETIVDSESRPTQERPKGSVPVGFEKRVKEVYAEGNVIVRQGEEVHACDAAFFDLVHERGIVVDPRSRFPVPTNTGEPATLTIKAAELRMLSQYRMEAIGAQISTCPFGNPHYHVASEKVEIYRARAREQAGREPPPGGEPTPNFFYTASGNTLFAGSGFPVLWLPDISGDSTTPQGRTLRYFKDARFGHSSQFGWEPGITLGDDLRTRDGKKWGAWLLDLDYLSKRGPGVGVDFAYEKPLFYKGEIKTSYQRDHGEDEFYGTPPSEDRGRFSIRHRVFFPADFQLDLELNAFSDRGYYPTYFEDEFKQDKPPETYAYLKRAWQNSAVTGFFSTRINDWENVTEYRPKLDYLLVAEPLFDVGLNPVYLTARAEVARPKQQFDEDLHLPSISNFRADVDTLLEYGFLAGPVKVTPFAGIRSTYYEVDRFRNPDLTRTGFTYGASAAMTLSRNFGITGGLFDLDGLRHVIQPAVEYRRTTGVDLHPEDLYIYDETDEFDNVEEVTFELRNLFQTVRHTKDVAARVDEVFDLNLEISWFPDADRDNGGDPWSNLRGDGVVRFSDDLQIVGDFEWNPTRRDLEAYNIAAGYAPSDKFQAYAGFRHFDDLYDVVFAQVNWRISDKWLTRVYGSYDVFDDRGVEHDLVISRIGHDWVFSLFLGADIGEDDYSFGIGLEPRLFFDPILRPAGRRREPEFQYLGTTIQR